MIWREKRGIGQSSKVNKSYFPPRNCDPKNYPSRLARPND